MAETTSLFTKPAEDCEVKRKATVFWKNMLVRVETWTLCGGEIGVEISRIIRADNIEITWKKRGLERGWGDILIEYGPHGYIVGFKDVEIEEVEGDAIPCNSSSKA